MHASCYSYLFSNESIPRIGGCLVECLMTFLLVILASQIVIYRDKNGIKHMYIQTVGISTGLSCGTQLANAFLITFDLHMKQLFREQIRLYRRFVDDVLVVAEHLDLNMFLSEANRWNPAIHITHDTTEDGSWTNFLDLTLIVKDSIIKYSTYRKPMNTYQYTPFNSSCPMHTKLGILESEFRRLLRTNMFEEDYAQQVTFFAAKLRERGYPAELIYKYVLKFPWKRKAEILSKTTVNSKTVVPFKLIFAHGLGELGLGSILKKTSSFLPSWFGDNHRCVVCYTSQPNLFRRRFARFL